MPMKRHDDSQRSGRLTVTQPVHHIVPRTPYPVPRTPYPVPRTPYFSHTSCRSLTARADRPVRDPAHAVAFTTAVAVGAAERTVLARWGAHVQRAAHPTTRQAPRPGPFTVNCRNRQKMEVQNDTQRTARARGVSRGEPAESHAARFKNLTQTGRPRCGHARVAVRQSSQGAAIRSAILSK